MNDADERVMARMMKMYIRVRCGHESLMVRLDDPAADLLTDMSYNVIGADYHINAEDYSVIFGMVNL